MATHTLDIDTLNRYLNKACPEIGTVLSAEKFSGGQSNPTFKLNADSGVYVLRRQPPGKLLKSAHAVDREYRVINALSNTEVPVPKVYHLCEDADIIGSMFYIMAYVEGTIYWNSALPEVESPKTRGAMYDE